MPSSQGLTSRLPPNQRPKGAQSPRASQAPDFRKRFRGSFRVSSCRRAGCLQAAEDRRPGRPRPARDGRSGQQLWRGRKRWGTGCDRPLAVASAVESSRLVRHPRAVLRAKHALKAAACLQLCKLYHKGRLPLILLEMHSVLTLGNRLGLGD